MSLRYTRESINAQLKARGIELLSEYRGAREPGRFRCVCGYEWESAVSGVLNRTGCNKCNRKKGQDKSRLTPEIINARLQSRGFVLLDGFIRTTTPARFRCPEGHEAMMTPGNVMKGQGCKFCADKVRNRAVRRTTADIKAALEGRSIRLLEEYVNLKTPRLFECEDCGYQWQAKPDNIIHGKRGCPVCAPRGAFRVLKSFIYVMQYANGLVKIGISNEPEKRLSRLKHAYGDEIVLVGVYQHNEGTGRDSWELEQKLHAFFADRHAQRSGFQGATELFYISPAEACEAIKNFGGVVSER